MASTVTRRPSGSTPVHGAGPAGPGSGSNAKRYLFLGVGFLFLGLGLLAMALPALPCVPFMFVAVACFSRSSRRFEQRLLRHPKLGPQLRRWQEHGVISVPVKLAATVPLLFSVASLAWFGGAIAGAVAGVLVAALTLYIWLRPSKVRRPGQPKGATT